MVNKWMRVVCEGKRYGGWVGACRPANLQGGIIEAQR